LASPMRRRKSRPDVIQSVLATSPLPNTDTPCLPASPGRRTRIAAMQKAKQDIAPPGLPSPTRRRKSKAFAVQSMLATSPPANADVSILPASPGRRARLAIMEKAKQDGVPLKVQPLVAMSSSTALLDPTVPAKKKLPFPDFANSASQSLRKLKPGLPVKKRVVPWLLEDPSSSVQATPR